MTVSDSPVPAIDTPLFNGLNADETAAVARVAALQSFERGEELLAAGLESPGMYIVVSGAVIAVVADAAGRERQVSTLGPGDCLGEMAIVTGEPCSATVRATTATEAWFIPRADFLALLESSPVLWRNIGTILSGRLARTSRQLATRPDLNVVSIVCDLPADKQSAFGAAVAASVARQTGRRVLLLLEGAGDDRSSHLTLPGLSDVATDKTMLKQHESPTDPANGLHGARVAVVGETSGASEEALLAALESMRPLYDHLLCLRSPGRLGHFSPGSAARTTLAVISEAGDGALPTWFHDLDAEGSTIEAAVCTKATAAGRLIEVLEEQLRNSVVRLAIAATDIPELMDDGGVEFRRSIDRLARRIGYMEIGVALGAGAAKGFAHIGVLRVLEEHGVPVDYVAGCSIGAVVGSLYAGGTSFEDMTEIMRGADRKLTRWTLPIWSLWSDAGLKKLLQENGARVRFSELAIPFAAVACDVVTGREVVIRRGTVWKAVRASVSVPGLFPAAILGNKRLADGGLVSPVPSQTARSLGADVVIAVDLMGPSARGRNSGPPKPRRNGARLSAPNLVEMLWRSMEIMQEEITIRSASTADVTVEPQLMRTRWKDFSHRGPEYIEAGAAAAREKLPEIHALLSRTRAD
ncbi:MAG: patatin-like phospholipase family protein [Dehalococcoidia bacterium]